jgi:hypothetical protein
MTSPLAGIVQAIEVAVGAQVKEGDLVITLEAMKMYTPINATSTGTIKAIHVKTGDAVEEGQASLHHRLTRPPRPGILTLPMCPPPIARRFSPISAFPSSPCSISHSST